MVKLPVGQDINRPKNKLPLQKEEYDFSNKTIIIAEDAQINYILLAKILEKTHIKILWAKNGRECVDMFILNKDNKDLWDYVIPILYKIENKSNSDRVHMCLDPNIINLV